MKFTEAILRDVILRVNHPIIITDKEGNFLLWNDSAKNILGLNDEVAPFNSWKNHYIMADIAGTRYEESNIPIIRAIKGEEVLKERVHVSDGITSGVYLDFDAFPIRDDKGEVVMAAASFTDVTNNIKMLKVVEDMQEMFTHMKMLATNNFFQ